MRIMCFLEHIDPIPSVPRMNHFIALTSLLATTTACASGVGRPMTHERLDAQAADIAKAPIVVKPSTVPGFLQAPAFGYDLHRDIRFRTDKSLWRDQRASGGGFEVQFFHPGFIFNRTIAVEESSPSGTRPVAYSGEFFDYGRNRFEKPLPADMGFSGFRIHHPLNNPAYFDEVAVFQGASYFRMLGRGQGYGLSSRGLAIDSAEPGVPEEFPVFKRFWLGKPAPGDKSVTVHALMDESLVLGKVHGDPAVIGAYTFVITPGDDTVVRVRATLHFRRPVRTLGVAPLTSMFWFGMHSLSRQGDFRPQAHDSDGLQMLTGTGEWVWHPLSCTDTLQRYAFQDRNPKGFGLIQRERSYAAYADPEVQYHRRPSAWVRPVGDWGPGAVHLAELPTTDETNDNIVAFWTPAKAPKAGDVLDLEYEIHWFLDNPALQPPTSRVVAMRYGPQVLLQPGLHNFVLDFAGDSLRDLPADAKVEAVVTIGGDAVLHHTYVQKVEDSGTWRAGILLKPGKAFSDALQAGFDRDSARSLLASPNIADAGTRDALSRIAAHYPQDKPVELRCFLRLGDKTLSETWSYRWNP